MANKMIDKAAESKLTKKHVLEIIDVRKRLKKCNIFVLFSKKNFDFFFEM